MSKFSDLFPGYADGGEELFIGNSSSFRYEFIVPDYINFISVVAIGGGGAGKLARNNGYCSSGGGGALAWVNNIQVFPGETLYIYPGSGGAAGASYSSYSSTGGGDSYIVRASDSTTLVNAGGGGAGQYSTTVGGAGGTVLVGSGGNGGAGGATSAGTGDGGAAGGGAGGYTGNGGNGGAGGNSVISSGGNGAGGAGAGGSMFDFYAGIAGGVFPYGEGPSGVAVAYNASGVPRVGSKPSNLTFTGSPTYEGYSSARYPTFSLGFGAGGGVAASDTNSGSTTNGSSGCVRIIWGFNRAFPSTNCGATHAINI